MSQSRKDIADAIADICIEEWENYGILPSVAVGQAFVESGLYSGGSNLFGVIGSRGLGVESATYRYMKCLHNGYFPNVAWHTDREIQLSYILSRGHYCEGEYPGGRYYSNVLHSIYRYGWDSYDDQLFKRLKKKREKALRKERQKRKFRITIDESLPEGTAVVDPKWIKKGSTIIYGGGIVEAIKTRPGLGSHIIIGRRKDLYFQRSLGDIGFEDLFDTAKFKVKLEVIEDAFG